MTVIHKVFKVIGRIILILLLICILIILAAFIFNKIQCGKEYDKLKAEGMAYSVSAGDYDLNVCKYGDQQGAHKIICMAGFGCSDMNVTFRPLTDKLSDENLIVFVDRAGYGLSEDSTEPQTVERIVDDYRNALSKAGVKGPYVLLPHSIGGVYASYWQNKYPDEIEGVAFLDGSVLSDKGFEGTLDPGFTGFAEALGCKAGLLRPLYRTFYYLLPDSYSEHEQELADALTLHSGYSFAQNSEGKYADENCKKTYQELTANKIPKVYICAVSGFRTKEEVTEYITWVNAQMKHQGLPVEEINQEQMDKTAQSIIEEGTNKNETMLKPYLDKLGNCELMLVPGDHMIFSQKPDECAEVIKNFLKDLS